MIKNIKITDILSKYENQSYCVCEETDIVHCICETVKESLKSYCKKNNLNFNSRTKRESYFDYWSFEGMINELLSQFDSVEPKKMTIKDIEKQLGHKIEIIGE